MGLVDGRVLITGASGGLGQAIARAFGRRGASLVLSGRRASLLHSLAEDLGGRAVRADLALAASVQRLADAAGDIDVLIANAGLPATGTLSELSQAQIDTMLDVNLRAPIALARALAPGMVARERGHIVLISSLSGKAASPSSSIYNATKFGLRGFGLALRQDLRASGVGVSVVLPGFVRDAGMFADTGVRLPPGIGTSTPEEVADAVILAVERNRAEVAVAPMALRFGASVASVAPALAAGVQRVAGGGRVARRMAAHQSGKRP